MRLNKYIASTGYCSRRKADTLIEQGYVTVNGNTAEIGQSVEETDTVHVNGKRISTKEQDVYLVFNKPYGVICTADEKAHNNIYEYLPHDQRLLYVGRLDVESSGLMLMTSNGNVANAIAHGSHEHEKEYVVTVNKSINGAFLRAMKSGVVIDGEVTKPARAKQLKHNRFSLVLTEGRNRQIRKMCHELGYEVLELKRIRIMNIQLGQLGPGNYRPLTKKERRTLLQSI